MGVIGEKRYVQWHPGENRYKFNSTITINNQLGDEKGSMSMWISIERTSDPHDDDEKFKINGTVK